jgi:hypothetical protein
MFWRVAILNSLPKRTGWRQTRFDGVGGSSSALAPKDALNWRCEKKAIFVPPLALVTTVVVISYRLLQVDC